MAKNWLNYHNTNIRNIFVISKFFIRNLKYLHFQKELLYSQQQVKIHYLRLELFDYLEVDET